MTLQDHIPYGNNHLD